MNEKYDPKTSLSGRGVSSIAKNTFYLLGGRWLTTLIQGAYAIVLARMLGPELYGLYNYGLSWYMAFILFASLVTAGMPFNLLVGAAPNAIAYDSKQFSTGEFFSYGWIANAVLMGLLAIFVYFIWPLMGMPVLAPKA